MRAALPKLGVDLDGCIYSFDHAARTYLQMQGHDIEVRESTRWNEIPDQVPERAWRHLWTDREVTRQVFAHAPAYPGAIKAIRRLQQKVRLVIITHRPTYAADATLGRLAHDRIAPYAVIHAAGKEKSTVMPDCVAYIEDRTENALELVAETGAPVLVPRRPYNSGLEDAGGILYYDGWEEVEAWVQKLL